MKIQHGAAVHRRRRSVLARTMQFLFSCCYLLSLLVTFTCALPGKSNMNSNNNNHVGSSLLSNRRYQGHHNHHESTSNFSNSFSIMDTISRIRSGSVTSSSTTSTSTGVPMKKKYKKRRSSTSSSSTLSPPGSATNTVAKEESNKSLNNSDAMVDSSSVASPGQQQGPVTPDKMPTLFTDPDESIYDKYAACLAATEGLRRLRDSALKESNTNGGASSTIAPLQFIQRKLSSMVDLNSSPPPPKVKESKPNTSTVAATTSPTVVDSKEAYKRACAQYVLNSSKVIQSLGLSVTQFNQLGRQINKDPYLKLKVMEQAYLYRMASTIQNDKIPFIQDPNSQLLLKSLRRKRVQMFAQSITEIEELRQDQRQKLIRALHVDKIPEELDLSNPNILPLLNPKVRAVVEAFPLQAQQIVRKYGLNSDEFNQMLEESKGNPIFRWRLKRYMRVRDQDVDDSNKSFILGNE